MRRINGNTRWQWIGCSKPMTMLGPHFHETTTNSQSPINEVPSPRKQRSATMRDLLLGINNRRDNGRINDARHSGLWLDRRLRQMDEIQWGTLPFRSEAYVSLGTVTLQFPPYWFGSMAIMTTTTFIITARSMTHPIQH